MFSRLSAGRLLVAAAAVGGVLTGCSSSKSAPSTTAPAGTTQVMMDFARASGFYAAPFPSDDLLATDGTINLNAFPNPYQVSMMAQAIGLASQTGAFARTGGVFFQTTAAVDPTSLPTVNESVKPGASAFLLAVDPSAPDYLTRYPVEANFEVDGGPYGSPNLLSLVPIQGVPMKANELYAAVVTTAVKDATGKGLVASEEMTALAGGHPPSVLSAPAAASYARAFTALAKAGVSTDAVVGLAAFTTGDPTTQYQLFVNDVLSRPLPQPYGGYIDVQNFDDYCVFYTLMNFPDYQSGTPPFTNSGGNWVVDPTTGKPVMQREEQARLFITIPRSPMPPAGYPISVFVRTGAGGDRPLVDRGTQATNGGPPIVPGSGPAMFFARAGFAGISPDGPLGGLRNTTNANEDFTIFNVFNPVALRDNVRESALELGLFAHVLPTLSFDVSPCPGAGPGGNGGIASFDTTHLAIMSHSMGSTISPLTTAFEPSYQTQILSGAGSSWIENVVYKQLPLDVPGVLGVLLDYTSSGRTLTEHDPAATIFQWAIESADPQVYDERIIRDPIPGAHARDVLMVQGIVDHYILPPIANATTLTLGLDLAGEAIDQATPAESPYTPILPLLPLVGHSQIQFPVQGNVTGGDGRKVTSIVMQAPGDAVEDGHEVIFQTDPPKHEYQCFLASSLVGTPIAPALASTDAGCAPP
jgi:hypothetical protein